MGRHVVIFFVASRVFHSFRDHDRADFEGSEERDREQPEQGRSMLVGSQKWPIFGICQNLTPKKGDTSQDPKTRVRSEKEERNHRREWKL